MKLSKGLLEFGIFAIVLSALVCYLIWYLTKKIPTFNKKMSRYFSIFEKFDGKKKKEKSLCGGEENKPTTVTKTTFLEQESVKENRNVSQNS